MLHRQGNVTTDLREIRWEGVDWMNLSQDRDKWWDLMNTVMNLWVPWKAVNFLTRWVAVNFCSKTLLHGVS